MGKHKVIGCVGHDCAACKRIQNDAETVHSMLEMGDLRLQAQDGPCGGQLPELSIKEWRKVYLACQRIAKFARA